MHLSVSKAALFRAVLALLAMAFGPPAVAGEAAAEAGAGPLVVLLHGLARSSSSMDAMADSLRDAGFRVCNLDYPSRAHAIDVLAAEHVAPAIERCAVPGETVNFVTHSMGGIIVRQLAVTGRITPIGRVVMLGPPNRGSEVVDELGSLWAFDAINGPAGAQLGTSPQSLVNRLGPAPFDLGIIAGSRSINGGLSLLIPGPDDGKVSIENTKLDGMRDFAVVEAAHPFLMGDPVAIRYTISFLRASAFAQAGAAASE